MLLGKSVEVIGSRNVFEDEAYILGVMEVPEQVEDMAMEQSEVDLNLKAEGRVTLAEEEPLLVNDPQKHQLVA